jgi:hypothetical protein
MYIKYIDAYGNELGLYRTIKEAASKIETSPRLLSTLFKYKLPLEDGSKLLRAVDNNVKRQADTQRMRLALAEYSNVGTHYRFLAKKYNLDQQQVRRAVARHNKESRLHLAYSQWLASGGVVSTIAEQHDVSTWSLSTRIKRGLQG